VDKSKRRDLAISLVFFAVTWLLFTVSVIADPDTTVIREWDSRAPWPPVSLRMNYLFDSDGPRVVYALINESGYGGTQYTNRHPSYVLFLAPVMSVLRGLGISAVLGGLIISAFFGAAAVAAAYLTLRKWRVSEVVAGAWTVIFAASTGVWLMSSVVDSFAANALCIVGVFYLAGPELAEPRRYPRHFARYMLFSVVAIGITLANVVYIAAGYAAGWWTGRKRTREHALAPVVMGLGVMVALVGLVGVQDLVYPLTTQRSSFPYSHTELFRVDRETAPERFATVVQTLGPDALVMRSPEVGLTPSPFYAQPGQMILFESTTALYWCSLLALLGLVGVAGLILRRHGRFESSVPRGMALLALGFIVYNILFAFAFDGYHGPPVLFAAHVVFPIIVLLVSFTTVASQNRLFVAGLIATTVVIAGANTKSVVEVRRLANLPCLEWAPEDTWPGRAWPTCETWE
jgi:hypothetical protein